MNTSNKGSGTIHIYCRIHGCIDDNVIHDVYAKNGKPQYNIYCKLCLRDTFGNSNKNTVILTNGEGDSALENYFN